jgi:hypothetical protein
VELAESRPSHDDGLGADAAVHASRSLLIIRGRALNGNPAP